MKKLAFLFLAVVLSVSFASISSAGGVAGMFATEKEESTVSETEINIPQIKDGEEYYIRNRILEEDMPYNNEAISSQKILPKATINGQPAKLIHQDSDKSVYGGPDSVYTPNTKIGVIILGE